MLGIGKLGLSAKITLAMGLLLVASAGTFYLYYKSSQNTIASLNQEVGTERVARAVAEATVDTMREQVNTQTRELSRLADEMAGNRQAQERMTDIFAEHDLNRLANARPDMIETRVNNGSRDVLTQLEAITNPLTYNPELIDEEVE